MITWLVVYGLIWLALAALFAVGSYFLLGFVNDAPPEPFDLLWRAPAASAVATLMTAWLCHLTLTAPTVYAPPLEFAAAEETAPATKLIAVRGQQRANYQLRKDSRGKAEYFDLKDGRPLTDRPDAIIIEEEGQEVTFTAQKDGSGKFVTDPGQPLRYNSTDGRYMQEGYWGRVSKFRSGLWVLYLFLNVLHLLVWWVAIWPLLRFPWAQALLIALIFTVANTFLFLPLLTRASWWG